MATRKKAAKKAVFDEKKFWTWLRSGLRSMSRRYPPIYEALAAAKRPYTGDNKKQKVCYECAKCGTLESAKNVAVDHTIDCGKLASWEDVQGFMARLFCGKDGLAVLCHTCHDVKTYQSKYNVSEAEAIIAKEAAKIMKLSKEKILAYLQQAGYDVSTLTNVAKRKEAVINHLKRNTK
jgi:hypothetical protein